MRIFGEKKRRGGYQGKKIHLGAAFRGGWFRRAREPLVIGRLRKEFNVALLKRFTIFSRPNLRFGTRSFTINSGLCGSRKRTHDAPSGTISSTAADVTPRQMQFALKMLFQFMNLLYAS
jgi:hypothetical protein